MFSTSSAITLSFPVRSAPAGKLSVAVVGPAAVGLAALACAAAGTSITARAAALRPASHRLGLVICLPGDLVIMIT